MSLKSPGSVKSSWTRDQGEGPIEVQAPHRDVPRALLTTLRFVHDESEGSGLAFTHICNLISAAAHRAELTDLVSELKIWKKAHAKLKRTHVRALQHELVVEAGAEDLGEPTRGPMSGMPDVEPQVLIRHFTYGETLHRDEEAEATIAGWDAHPLVGPLMRQEVRADAAVFVDFYAAFAGFVDRWLAPGS